ncbi:MAG: VWA domain-containing protein [Clostridia bacterium]|nr:VWA domain-containing protein [Clostridia bacterium]
MTFLYPIGLLGLIGIPILIIVYLIKNRYTEQTVASTFLWRLSERFLKRRNPLSRITGIISLILQLLLVAALSLAVAHPIIVLPGAAHEYCFILDGSASMNMQMDGKTRFDLAKEEILKVVDEAKEGSTYTVVYVGGTTEVLLEKADDKSRVSDKLATLQSTDGAIDYTDAIGVAQGYFDGNPSTRVYLVTDTDYSTVENLTLVNVSRGENNVSVEDVIYFRSGKTGLTVSGNIISYGADRLVDVEIYVDGAEEPLSATKVQAFKDVPTPFTFTVEAPEFYSVTVKAPIEDSYAKDNSVTVYDIESENSYNALLVSDAPFLIEAAIDAVSTADITVMTTEAYKKEEERLSKLDKTVNGYSLYIFDCYDPATLPSDGSVWFIGPGASVEGSGFSVQGEVTLETADTITISSSTASIVRKLTANMVGDDIYVSKYVKCGLYADFTTLYSYKGNPVIFTGVNSYGNREVVFAFNLHDSDITLSLDYLAMLGNLLDYSFPEVIEKTDYFCGDTAEINVISGCNSIRVETPDGEEIYTDTTGAVSEFELTKVGEYKITVDISGAERPAYYVYSSVPKEERQTETVAESISIYGEAAEEGSDGRYDPMTLLFILAALLFAAEWMVYCYDKYQLR